MKKINTLEAYIKFGTKLFHLTWEKMVNCKTSHGENEKKGEFGSPRSESLCFKWGTPIMLEPKCTLIVESLVMALVPYLHMRGIIINNSILYHGFWYLWNQIKCFLHLFHGLKHVWWFNVRQLKLSSSCSPTHFILYYIPQKIYPNY